MGGKWCGCPNSTLRLSRMVESGGHIQQEKAMQPVLIVLSANSEWRAARNYYREDAGMNMLASTPYGEAMQMDIEANPVVFMQGGWGKVSAAASCQYGLQRWNPRVVINLGTCGGFAGRVVRGTTLLVTETVIYDIYEQMGDPQAAIKFYTCRLDLRWLKEPYPQPVQCARLISADRDIIAHEIDRLVERFDAVAADWESGAIAWVCQQNTVRSLILRGVSDLVDAEGGEAYGNPALFHQSSAEIISSLLDHLAEWLRCIC